jgi:trehalose-6-phosphate synthase
MDPAERVARMRKLRAQVHRKNLEHWSELFLSALLPERVLAAQASVGT